MTTGRTIDPQDLQPFDTVRIGNVPYVYPLLLADGMPFWPFHPDHSPLHYGISDVSCRCLSFDDIIIFMGLRHIQIKFAWNEEQRSDIITKQVAMFLFHGQLYWTHPASFKKTPMQIVGHIRDEPTNN